MITYYVNVLGNSNPMDFQLQTVVNLGVGNKIKNAGVTYSVVSEPVYGVSNQAWIDVVAV